MPKRKKPPSSVRRRQRRQERSRAFSDRDRLDWLDAAAVRCADVQTRMNAQGETARQAIDWFRQQEHYEKLAAQGYDVEAMMKTRVHTNERLPPWHPWCSRCGCLKEPGTPCTAADTAITFCARCGRVATAKSTHGIAEPDITKACGKVPS